MAKPTPSLTEAQVADIQEMHGKKRSVPDIARQIGVSAMTIRRTIDPDRYGFRSSPAAKKYSKRLFADEQYNRPEPKFRITDFPDSLTAAICGDPTPQRRRLIEEGRV